MIQTDLLISQDQIELLSKSIKGEKGKDPHNLKAIKSDDASSQPKANFLSFLDGIPNDQNLPQIENITPLSANRSETINKKAELMALNNLSDEIKPDIKEKQDEESLADSIEASMGMNVRPDDEAIDKDLLLRFGSGLHTGKEGMESTSSAGNQMVSSPEPANGPLERMDATGEADGVPAGPQLKRPSPGPAVPGSEKSAAVSDEVDNQKEHVLRPELAMNNGDRGLDKGMINPGEKRLFSEEIVLNTGLDEAKTKRFFDETKTGKNVDLNKRDLLSKLNSINQEPEKVTDNLSKNFANQESSPNSGSDPQNNKPANTKIQVFDSDIFSNKIDKIESDNGADDLLSLNGQSSDKVSQGISTTKETTTKETNSLPKPLETDVLSQIVKKAVLNFKNGQTEVKIEIKPESLGHIRMQISTENHQVTAKIMAENPLVKAIIENNLHQLKTELENHGLEMDKFDVDVFGSDVSDQNGAEYKNPSFLKKAGETDEDKMENSLPEVKEGSIQVAEERRGTNAIDFFA